MQPIDQYPIYELGAALQQLRVAATPLAGSPGSPPSPLEAEQFSALWFAEHHLQRLVSGVPFRVHYCLGAVNALRNHIAAILAHNRSLATEQSNALTGPPPPIEWRWHSLRSGIDIFEHQFSAELQKTATYAVPERGIFNIEGLVDKAYLHIHGSVRGKVNSFALEEFKAAGRCLAFGLYSASGFHSARAVESVLRDYHKEYLPNQPSDDMSMGQMASALDDTHKAKKKAQRLPKQNTIRHLKDFTGFDRNPLMHKTVTLEEIHAVTLFNAAASVIAEMSSEMIENLAQLDGAQLPLLGDDPESPSADDQASVSPVGTQPS